MTTDSRRSVDAILRAGRDQNTDTFLHLMAPDGYLEWPYRPPGAPARVQGHTRIRAHLTAAATLIRIHEHRDTVIHQSTDPGVLIAEYQAHGTVVSTGAPLQQNIIAVFTVRDGLIHSYRDYLDPLALLTALGR